jgi:hypothetical protein
MGLKTSALAAILTITGGVWLAGFGTAVAQPATTHEIPQSQFVEHQDNLEHLQRLSGRPGALGMLAVKAHALFKQLDAREAEYVMPPLSLLPALADGKVTPDMRWALDMADRVKADREVIFQEQSQLIGVLNELQMAGQRAHDAEAIDFAKSAATDTLTDEEILEPTVLVIGDLLRARLAIGH